MALMNGGKVGFDDIRMIICINGFTIGEKYQLAELGFWSRKLSGVIPFKSTKVWSKMDHLDKITINYLTTRYHGIDINQLKNQDNLHQSDLFGAIRSIYHLCNDGKENRKLIGYLGNSCLLDILGRVGIGHYLVKLQDMYPNCDKFTLNKIQNDESYGRNDFAVCEMHKELETGSPPNCAKAIANYLAIQCQNNEKRDQIMINQ